MTLPGLESKDIDRSRIGLKDHVEAIQEAVLAESSPVVLAVHSAAAISGYVVSDRIPEKIAAMVYVDTFPQKSAMNPDFEADEMPIPPMEELDEADIRGMSAEHLQLLQQRAVPVPGGVVRDAPVLENEKRLDVPSTVICTSHSSEEIKAMMKKGYDWISGLAELHNVTYVDLPTHHWPMWTHPKELASIIGETAKNS